MKQENTLKDDQCSQKAKQNSGYRGGRRVGTQEKGLDWCFLWTLYCSSYLPIRTHTAQLFLGYY